MDAITQNNMNKRVKIVHEPAYGYDDVFICSRYTRHRSRRDFDVSTDVGGLKLQLPVFSANMQDVTGNDMVKAMASAGGMAVLHRFWPIQNNQEAFEATGKKAAVSIGVGDEEFRRAEILYYTGARYFFVDVAHGAQLQVAEQVSRIREALPDIWLAVGNFATKQSILQFLMRISPEYTPNAIKVGISNGSACLTRVKTGVGVPQFSSVMECVEVGLPVIADGGIREEGHVAKALGAGASAVMIGGMLAGCDETPGEIQKRDGHLYKVYSGSASALRYRTNDKNAKWRTPEGNSNWVRARGPVANVMQEIEAGLRSSFSYSDAANLQEFHENVEFGVQTHHGYIEGTAHGA